MQTDVCIRIINEKMNKKILVRWVFDVPAIIAFGFSMVTGISISGLFNPKIQPRTSQTHMVEWSWVEKSRIVSIP